MGGGGGDEGGGEGDEEGGVRGEKEECRKVGGRPRCATGGTLQMAQR